MKKVQGLLASIGYTISLVTCAMEPPFTLPQLREAVDIVAVGTVSNLRTSDVTYPSGQMNRVVFFNLSLPNFEKGKVEGELKMRGIEVMRNADGLPGGRGIVGLANLNSGVQIRVYCYKMKDRDGCELAGFEKL